jgi:hypothetical protein
VANEQLMAFCHRLELLEYRGVGAALRICSLLLVCTTFTAFTGFLQHLLLSREVLGRCLT